MSNPYLPVRDLLLERMERDLIGPIDPGHPAEVLADLPSDKYLTGILYPRQTRIAEEEDDEMAAANDEEGDEAAAVPLGQCIRPASAGLSFTVAGGAGPLRLRVEVMAARYVQRWLADDGTSLSERSLDGKDRVRWLRIPPPEVFVPLALDKLREPEMSLAEYGLAGLNLYVQVAAREDGVGVTLVLINAHSHDPKDSRAKNEERCWFQTGLRVEVEEGGHFVGRSLRREAATDDDRTAALIYRDFQEYAVGHTCGATWDLTATRVRRVESTWLPVRVVDAISADGDKVFKPLGEHPRLKPFSAAWLSNAPKDDLLAALEMVPAAYNIWIKKTSDQFEALDITLRSYAEEHQKLWVRASKRMSDGIDYLRDHPETLQAVRLANEAMELQRQWSRGKELIWRPFQIAFLLLVLESSLVPGHDDRDVMDLLWFPTGGGKTEAYLAVIALLLFHRRLSPQEKNAGAGVNVIMRYTLRVLTTQQFERAAVLICACEKIRVGVGDEVCGSEPFSIGLWVGGSAIPNKVEEARDDRHQRAMQIRDCPCCKKPLQLTDDTSRYAVACRNAKCHFGNRGEVLPLWTVDEDVYRELPSLLIGTIDKFAQIARREETAGLFGIGTPHAPPDLIIQDELHLISGPLGTISGLYEIAIDAFCSAGGAKPKVIGSTATIKMAQDQVLALFDRKVFQFPPPGIDSSNSCFAVRDTSKPGRLYLGVTTAGRSAKFTLQAVSASLLQSSTSAAVPNELRDAYWTLVAYFNSLRELGGAHVMMLDDVPKSLLEYAARRSEPPRQISSPEELTSRLRQDEIPEVLKNLAVPYDPNGYAVDALLSTNMISVGVDIPRLGLMVVNGQPKGIAEYIQATSRVGRDAVPGLVVTVFNNAKPRDRSHYETFSTWHGTLYRDVEASSVTPFAPRAVDKALRAVLVAMVRHLVPAMRGNPVLTRALRAEAEAMRAVILQRVRDVDPDEYQAVEARLNVVLDEWETRGGVTTYWNDFKEKQTLLIAAERVAALQAANRSSGAAWPAPNSMREVEAGVKFRLEP